MRMKASIACGILSFLVKDTNSRLSSRLDVPARKERQEVRLGTGAGALAPPEEEVTAKI